MKVYFEKAKVDRDDKSVTATSDVLTYALGSRVMMTVLAKRKIGPLKTRRTPNVPT